MKELQLENLMLIFDRFYFLITENYGIESVSMGTHKISLYMKSLMYIFTIVLALCFVSCDPPIFQIPIDGVYKKKIGVDCGTIDVECKTIGGVSFNIKQVYRVTNPLDINPKNLSIKYKNNDIKYTVYLNGALIDERKKIMNDDTVVVSFTKKVRKNDTIIINFDNFLYCKEKPITIGDIPFVFNKK